MKVIPFFIPIMKMKMKMMLSICAHSLASYMAGNVSSLGASPYKDKKIAILFTKNVNLLETALNIIVNVLIQKKND